MKLPEDLGRAAIGAGLCAVAGALLVGVFFFVMFGFEPDAWRVGVRALLTTVPAAYLVGLPLYLLVNRRLPGLGGLIIAGAGAGCVWAAASNGFDSDPYLYSTAVLLGGCSAMAAYPIVVPRARARRASEPGG